MGFTAKEYRAIGWYAQKHDLKMGLCSQPYVYFTNQHNETERQTIGVVLDAYEAGLKIDARAKKENDAGHSSGFVVRFPEKPMRDSASNKN